jgi:uncharacterized protein (TIGR03032 family)
VIDQPVSPYSARTPTPVPADPPPPEDNTKIGVSRGLRDWLIANKTSFAFSSYQSGRLVLVGAMANGTVSIHQQRYDRVMGLCWTPNRLYLASRQHIFRLENVSPSDQLGRSEFDVMLVPRDAHTTGNIDVHEMAMDAGGRLIMVNTLYSCLATLDPTHSFRPIWKPSFISQLAPEDRCHLNGLGMLHGKPKYVTAVSQTDVADGWHGRPFPRGVVIDVETDRVVTDELSMPHSPRTVNGRIYALDSGRGFLVDIDPATGKLTDVAFCPGFLRGLAIHGHFALVTVSKPRHGGFTDLPIEQEMSRRFATAMCGVLIIDLRNGDLVEWVKLEGDATELFAVELMPNVMCPMSVGLGTLEFDNAITFDAAVGPLGDHKAN